jgi:hypothetical protein
MSRNRYPVPSFQRQGRRDVSRIIGGLTPTTATGAITGTASIGFSNSGTLTGSGALAGTAAMQFGAGSSTLLGTGALSGTIALVFGYGSSALTGAGALAGTAALSLNVAGDVKGSGALLGTAAIELSGAAALTGIGELAGTAAITLTPSGTLDAPSGALEGSASLTLDGAGTLGGTGALTGTAALVLTGSAAIGGVGALSGAAALTLDGAATLSGTGALSGSTALAFDGTGTLRGTGALAGTSALELGATGTLDQPSGAMSGTTALAFDGSGALTGTGVLQGSAAIAFSNSATLTALVTTTPGGAGGVPIGGRLRYRRGGSFVYGRVPQYIAQEHPKVARALAYAKRAAAKPELYDEYEEHFVAALRSLRGVLEEIQQQIDAAELAENEKKQKQLEEHQAQLLAAKDAIEKALIKAHKKVQVLLAESAKLAEDVNNFLMSEAAIKKADRERQEAEDRLILQAAYAIFFDD